MATLSDASWHYDSLALALQTVNNSIPQTSAAAHLTNISPITMTT
jgi:hypothetical protein